MTATLTPSAVAVVELPLDRLAPHPANRKHFDQEKLKELADSLKAVGQLTPIIVRDMPGDVLQIIAGERRWRAAKLAGLETLTCVVRELSESEALEALLVENMQRADVHPLEEATAYAALITTHRLDVEAIAGKVGKSQKYVYDRMKLLQLIPALQKLFLEEKFLAGHAILLARLTKDDQARAIGTEKHQYTDGGLFAIDHGQDDDWLPGLKTHGLKTANTWGYKAASVRELQRWIDDNVRFDVDAIDGFLLPETAEAVTAAKEVAEKVVQITHDHFVRPEARDETTRTYGPQSWKRADGTDKAKACEYAITGVVVVGPQRGESFKVCIEKKKCGVHWKKERAEATRRAKLRTEAEAGGESAQDRWKKEEEARQQREQKAAAERKRWWKAKPVLIEAAAEKLKTAQVGPGSKGAELILEEFDEHFAKRVTDLLGKPKTAEDLLRHLLMRVVLGDLEYEWSIAENAPRALAVFGVDAKAIVDKVSPRDPVQTPAKARGKKQAGDVRRAKSKKASAK